METTATFSTTTTNYAGFGQRFVALIIDGIIIGVIYGVILAPVMAAIGLGVASGVQNAETMTEEEAAAAAMGMVGAIVAAVGSIILIIYAIQVLYYAFMESSKFQGSLGKMAMGIKVVDMNGERITFGKAFLRSIGKIISGTIFYIGFLMAAFTEKKQGLHDMIASTLVLKK
ncbi:RDD family protein [Chryseosolibacter indicus]|uniref:RDD family protein n=1 Tax=Chryseosolibacter indicus TaxID=2782351 RepID=A0ABS5VNT9_9BACT|nr:RDD family protein [Chryseosolibacter indicus]MBT1703098.1 RDD family protein [Chryseosolibacter indicus]